jgi:hypothetical protein
MNNIEPFNHFAPSTTTERHYFKQQRGGQGYRVTPGSASSTGGYPPDGGPLCGVKITGHFFSIFKFPNFQILKFILFSYPEKLQIVDL